MMDTVEARHAYLHVCMYVDGTAMSNWHAAEELLRSPQNGLHLDDAVYYSCYSIETHAHSMHKLIATGVTMLVHRIVPGVMRTALAGPLLGCRAGHCKG